MWGPGVPVKFFRFKGLNPKNLILSILAIQETPVERKSL